jgi:hypothetical protein
MSREAGLGNILKPDPEDQTTRKIEDKKKNGIAPKK